MSVVRTEGDRPVSVSHSNPSSAMPRDPEALPPLSEPAAAAPAAGPASAAGSGRRITVGTLLRRCREERGLSLQALARDLRIRPGYIEAIEDGRLSELPALTYAVGYVRAYAAHLGFDGDRVAQRFRDESSSGHQPKDLSFRLPQAHGELPKGAVLLVGAFIALAAYSGWYVFSSTDTEMVRQVQPVPERLSAWLWKEPAGTPVGGESAVGRAEHPLPSHPVASHPVASHPVAAAEAPVVASAPPHQAARAGEAAPAPASHEPARLEPASQELAHSAPPAAGNHAQAGPAQAAAGAFPPARAAAVEPAQNSRIVLKARMDCWVEIKDTGSGKLVYARLLRAGETYAVTDQPGLKLLAGNAGGLDIIVDGQTLAPLGRPGAVVRNIALEPAGLAQQGSPSQGGPAPSGPSPSGPSQSGPALASPSPGGPERARTE